MAARSKPAKTPKSEEEKYQTRLDNYHRYHKDKDGVAAYTNRLASLIPLYEKVRRAVKKGTKDAVLPIDYHDPPDSEATKSVAVREGNILFLRREIIKEIKNFKKIFSWSKKREPVRRKKTAELTVLDIGGNNSPTRLGDALINLIRTERIVDPSQNSLLDTLKRELGQESLLAQGYALSTTVTNVLFLISSCNHLQDDVKMRSKVRVDAAFAASFRGVIPAVYSYKKEYVGKKIKLLKVPNSQGFNTFTVLAQKPREKTVFDPESKYIKTQNFQEIRAVNMYSNEDVKRGNIPGGVRDRDFLADQGNQDRLLRELKIVARFRDAWANDPNTIADKRAAAEAQQQKKKSPK